MIVRIAFFLLLASMNCAAYEQARVKIYTDDNYRHIESNGIPEHSTGKFPNSGNPNSISQQSYHYQVPIRPTISKKMTPLTGQLFGIATNGVPFDPGTAELWQNDPNWRYEALTGYVSLGIDQNNAHVQPTGAYHYHGIPSGLLGGGSNSIHSKLVGWAADGFPIYAEYGYQDPNSKGAVARLHSSYKLKDGSRTGGPGGTYDGKFAQDFRYARGSGDLDMCNGRLGVTPEFPHGTYYYVLTDEFPFVPRCFRGSPHKSFAKGPYQQGGQQGRNQRYRGGPGGHHPPSSPSHRRLFDKFSFFGYAVVY